ncbi:MAG: division plane positioning ATPase MipZ, partial [Pseudomonadota bacterium]
HLIVALLKSGKAVGCLDLDLRQKSLWRYLENRAKWGVLNDLSTDDLPMPTFLPIQGNQHDSRFTAKKQETEEFTRTLAEFEGCDFLVIDCPGANTHLSRLAHTHADTIVTPMNDSFIDYDMLAQIDPETGKIKGPSLYSEVVWSARQERASAGVRGGIDWLVLRNRVSATRSLNKEAVGRQIEELASRIQFRTAKGFGDRVIYRELFTNGMTLLDLGTKGAPRKFGSMSHLAAKSELRGFLSALQLPTLAGQQEAA